MAEDILPFGPKESAQRKPFESISSKKVPIIQTGSPTKPSSAYKLVDGNDLDVSPIQDPYSILHNLTYGLSESNDIARFDEE